MKSALAIATLSLSLCLPAQAYEIQTGTILVCDTPSQVQRFADLFDGNVQVAIGAVNFEEKDPTACAMINLSYVEGPSLDMGRSPVACVSGRPYRGDRHKHCARIWACEPRCVLHTG